MLDRNKIETHNVVFIPLAIIFFVHIIVLLPPTLTNYFQILNSEIQIGRDALFGDCLCL